MGPQTPQTPNPEFSRAPIGSLYSPCREPMEPLLWDPLGLHFGLGNLNEKITQTLAMELKVLIIFQQTLIAKTKTKHVHECTRLAFGDPQMAWGSIGAL